MTRTTTSGMNTMLATRFHSRCRMLALELTNGTKIGFTDHDADLTYELIKDGFGSISYLATQGIVTSDIDTSCSMDAANFEVNIALDGTLLTLPASLGGGFDDATVYMFEVNHKDLTHGEIALVKGWVGEARIEGGELILEVRDQKAAYARVAGRVMTTQCPWEFADGVRCHATATIISATVSVASSALQFTVTYTGDYADDFFNKGTVLATLGSLLGTKAVEIEDWNQTSAGVAIVTLFTPLVAPPLVGDTFDIKNGCSKMRKSSDPSVPTCLTYDMVIDYGGFPDMPGTEKALKPTIPKTPSGGKK